MEHYQIGSDRIEFGIGVELVMIGLESDFVDSHDLLLTRVFTKS